MNHFEEITHFLEYLGDAIIIANEASEIVFANHACVELFGYQTKDMQNLKIDELMEKSPLKLKHPDLVKKFIQSNAHTRTMMTRSSLPCIDSSGNSFNVRISIATVTIDNKSYGVAIIQDFTSLQKEIEHLEVISHQDVLTGLYNRRYLQQITDQNSRILKTWHEIGVIYIDLDKFKSINDNYGHEVGDAVLKVVSKIINGCVRFDDIVFRLGGDEFLVLLNLTDVSNKQGTLKNISEKIYYEVIKPITTDEYEVSVGLSAGCGLYPENENDLMELINLADKAMYSSKNTENFVIFVK